jgi:NADPH:quinone reductase-like Zn-dependent oxidoreductase
MRAVVITKHGPPEVLQVQERPAPDRPLGGQVAIDVAAAGINFADTMARVGLYPDAPKPPTVVGYEVAGTVRAVGPGVEGLETGQRVFARRAELRAGRRDPGQLSDRVGRADPLRDAPAG